MAMKVGVASVIRKKSSSLCLFSPRLRTLKRIYDKFFCLLAWFILPVSFNVEYLVWKFWADKSRAAFEEVMPWRQKVTILLTLQKHDFDAVRVMTCVVLRKDWITLLYEGYCSIAFLLAVQTKFKFTVVMTMIGQSKETISTFHEESIVAFCFICFPAGHCMLYRGLRLIAATDASKRSSSPNFLVHIHASR